MLITLAIALFIIYVVSSRRQQKRKANESFFRYYGKYIIIGSVVLLTIVTMNILRPRVYITDTEEIIEVASETDNEYVAWKARERSSRRDPYNIEKLLAYVEDCDKFETYKKENLLLEEFSIIPEMQRLALAYADALVRDSSFESLYKPDPEGNWDSNFPDKTKPYHNFVIGTQRFNDGDFPGAVKALNREKELNPTYEKTYPLLYKAYWRYDLNKFRNFITNSENAQYLDQRKLREDYFNFGEYFLYFKTIYAESFVDFDIFALIAGLIISIVWMIFLRNMDFFLKERWMDMTIVFLGGAFFTNLCLFLYDTAHYGLGIGLNGEALNDLIYCIGVIGFSEETVKLIPWVLFAIVSKRFKEPFDYILYASVSALGFAFTENLIYLENPGNIVIRFIMSTTMHMFAASLVAYSMVLAKYKFKTKRAKQLAPVIGFILACIAHGFYDFWLISSSAGGLKIVTTIFFFLTIHIWFHMINNCTNHSSFFDQKLVKMNENIEFLSISILGIILLQYVIFCIEYGALDANMMLKFGSTFSIGFLLYVTFVLSNFKAIRGRWKRYSFPIVKLAQDYFHVPFIPKEKENHVGQHLRIFCPKDNPYIGDQLPISGHCERRVTISNEDDWYLFRLNKGVDLGGYHSHLVVIKPKLNENELSEEKIEIYLMFIPRSINIHSENIPIKQLRYTGKAYSRPI